MVIMSVVFIIVVFLLHIYGKFTRASAASRPAEDQ